MRKRTSHKSGLLKPLGHLSIFFTSIQIFVAFAERGGFEPPVPKGYNGFRDRHVKPLRHLSYLIYIQYFE